MAELILVRHGPTTFNDTSRLRGWMDPELTGAGVTQARALGETLRAEYDSFKLYSSDLARAHTTAACIAHDAVVTPALRPWNVGCMAGLPHDVVHETLVMYQRNPKLRVPFGEPFAEFCERFTEFVKQLRGRCVLVTHYRCCKLLQAWEAAGWSDIDMSILLADDVRCGGIVRVFTPW